jgi:hypothetical protein
MHGSAGLGDWRFELVEREGEFCAVRFDPINPAALRMELDQRFGPAEGDAGAWRVRNDSGEGLVAYRPYAAGLSGPAWINTRSGYRYGFDSAARLDTLIYYPPPAN